MRRHHTWLIAAALVVGALLWLWTQRPHAPGGALPSPPPATVPVDTAPRGIAADTGAPAPRSPVSTSPTSSPVTAPGSARAVRYPAFLPDQAHAVLAAIERGGPYAYRRDGAVFQNRERRLPPQPRGYYHEYTVPTPGEDDRGARRIVTGGGDGPPREFWYSDDHYRSFRAFRLDAGAADDDGDSNRSRAP